MANPPASATQKATVGVYYGMKIDPPHMLRVFDDNLVPAATMYYSLNYQIDKASNAPVDCEEIGLIRQSLKKTLMGLKRQNKIDFTHPFKHPQEETSLLVKIFAKQCLNQKKFCEKYSLDELKRNETKKNIPMQIPSKSVEFSDDYLRRFAQIHILETVLGVPLTPKPERAGSVWNIGAIHLFRVRNSDVPILFLRYPQFCSK